VSRPRPLFHEAEDEGGFLRRASSGEEMDLDITPMIDVTFLLLIFFMVASTMQATAENDIPPAKHGVGIESERSTIISIRLNDETEEQPVISLGDGVGRPAELAEVTDYVRQGVDAGRTRVIVKADRDVPHGFVQRVARAANAVEGIRFFIGVRDTKR
jgi:biopolymer transport protein TolR